MAIQDASVLTRTRKIAKAIPVISSIGSARPKLMDRLREVLRSRHHSRRTEQTYCLWVKRFIYFHNVRHPAEMAEPEINAFLTQMEPTRRSSCAIMSLWRAAHLARYAPARTEAVS